MNQSITPYKNTHITHTNKSCHAYARAMSHLRGKNVTVHTKSQCPHKYIGKRDIREYWHWQVTDNRRGHVTHARVMSHIWMSRVIHLDDRCEWIMSRKFLDWDKDNTWITQALRMSSLYTYWWVMPHTHTHTHTHSHTGKRDIPQSRHGQDGLHYKEGVSYRARTWGIHFCCSVLPYVCCRVCCNGVLHCVWTSGMHHETRPECIHMHNICMYSRLCIHAHIHMHIYVCLYIHIYVYTHTYMYIVCMHTCTYIWKNVYIYT